MEFECQQNSNALKGVCDVIVRITLLWRLKKKW